MWGCGDWFPEDGEREFFGYYSRPHIVGFIDDSLVIVADDKEWTQETSDGYAIGGRGHQRLCIFNYRVQEAGPRWTDTLDNFNDECNYALGQLIYHWRAFSSPPNSSITNAIELGDRTWNKDGKFGKRRSLMEEAQEVKASLNVPKNGKDSLYVGQVALDLMHRHPDDYRQLASRYILIGHSMGGVSLDCHCETRRVVANRLLQGMSL